MRWLVPACAASLAGRIQAAEMPTLALGGEIEEVCTGEGLWPSLACAAYLRGLLEGILAGEATATGGSVSFCLPAGTFDPEQIRRAFLAYIDKGPDRRSLDAGLLMLDALEDRFPCSDGGDQDDPPLPDDSGPTFVGERPRR